MTAITLTARPPFSFHSVVHSHGWMQLLPFVYDEGFATLKYVMRLSNGRVVDLAIREDIVGIVVDVSSTLTKSEKSEITGLVTWMLGLEMDFSEFYAQAREEPKLAQVENKAQGRVLRSPTFFEDVVKTILTTNTLWGATKRMNANLVSQFGESLASDPSRHAFPTPESITASTPDQLRSATRLGYRAPYVHELAVRVASGELDLEAFKTSDLPTPDLRKDLMKIKGIGAYAAANLLMLLGRYDFLTIDSWARKMVSHEWHGGDPVGPEEIESHFARWGKWKGLAYWFWDWSFKG